LIFSARLSLEYSILSLDRSSPIVLCLARKTLD